MKKRSQQNQPILVPNPKAKLFDQLREVLRFHHYSIRTEKTYCQWVRRYLAFHRLADRRGSRRGWRHPADLGAAEVCAFLSNLAVTRNVAASTQNQALNALVFGGVAGGPVEGGVELVLPDGQGARQGSTAGQGCQAGG